MVCCCFGPLEPCSNEPPDSFDPQSHFHPPISTHTMVRFTPEVKHHILTLYAANVMGSGYKALASRFAVKGGHSVIQRWHERWDGTPASLQPRPRSGRPRILTHRQVTEHILNPIRRENRAHRAVHYPSIRRKVIDRTGKEVSSRTIRRYGKERKIKQRTAPKRTAKERQFTKAPAVGASVLLLIAFLLCLVPSQSIPPCAPRLQSFVVASSGTVVSTSSSSTRLICV